MNADCSGKHGRRQLREGLKAAGQFDEFQVAGRLFPVACVALEITQRCNLDCTLCYLSENAEQAYDVPLVVLFQRIAMVHRRYGPGATIQITGGDPTLRKVEDIEALCQEIRRLNMRSCLMTNGIRANRPFLARLAQAGLNDVAFHVDLTQERVGFESESALNAVRKDYIGRARNLGLRILFNTTVYPGNLAEVPALCQFFRSQARYVSLVSFQMQADTGRGAADKRDIALTQDVLSDHISAGFNVDFPSKMGIGHSECSRYDHLAISGDRAVSFLANKALLKRVISTLEHVDTSGRVVADLPDMIRKAPLCDPIMVLRFATELLKMIWRLRSGLWAGRGRVSRMSVVLHSLMDAKALVTERCEACVFMVATSTGPVSMCEFNAERDAHLFKPVSLNADGKETWWSAATGQMTDTPYYGLPPSPKFKQMKGRERAAEMRRRGKPI
ncbi:radical SAM protein [Tateyamaria sp. ANG-S1]|uniref:radical SAM protein n=1 Tax=Tateyamaria sp. ANG-S1 TaxID=1577905 RepID=UPI00068F4801|nr:radical SAM protein [Tateyamaria sp. ANG-S1]